jgi:hypothetical protein
VQSGEMPKILLQNKLKKDPVISENFFSSTQYIEEEKTDKELHQYFDHL